VFLGNTPIPADHVRVLATLVKDPELAQRLQSSVARDAIVIRLDEDDRAAILKALMEPPPELEGVRDALAAGPAAPRGVPRLAVAADGAA
jgi:hypothetical protein